MHFIKFMCHYFVLYDISFSKDNNKNGVNSRRYMFNSINSNYAT